MDIFFKYHDVAKIKKNKQNARGVKAGSDINVMKSI